MTKAEMSKRWYQNNKEKKKACNKKYYIENKEIIKYKFYLKNN